MIIRLFLLVSYELEMLRFSREEREMMEFEVLMGDRDGYEG